MAFALLIGPPAFGRISTLADFDYQAVAVAAVDGFLKCFAKDRRRSLQRVANRQVFETADECGRRQLGFACQLDGLQARQ